MASFFSRAGSQYVVKELTHIWPFVTGFGIMTVAMHSIPTPSTNQ